MPSRQPATLDPRGPVVGWIGSPTTADYIEALAAVLQRGRRAASASCCGSAAPAQPVAIPGVDVDNRAVVAGRRGRAVQHPATSASIRWPTTTGREANAASRRSSSWRAACRSSPPRSASTARSSRTASTASWRHTGREWIEKLGRLIADPALRAQIRARRAASTIEERYSLHVNAPQLAAVLRARSRARRNTAMRIGTEEFRDHRRRRLRRAAPPQGDPGHRQPPGRGRRSARRGRRPRSVLRSTSGSSPRSSGSTAISRSCAAVRSRSRVHYVSDLLAELPARRAHPAGAARRRRRDLREAAGHQSVEPRRAAGARARDRPPRLHRAAAARCIRS